MTVHRKSIPGSVDDRLDLAGENIDVGIRFLEHDVKAEQTPQLPRPINSIRKHAIHAPTSTE